MHSDLIALVHHRGEKIRAEAVLWSAGAAMARTIGIVLEELRAARSERAVVKRLHRSDLQRARRVAIRRAVPSLLHQRLVALRQHGVHTDRQLVLRMERFE